MNKFGLVSVVAEKANISKKQATEIIDATIDAISEALKAGDKVQLVGFGSFDVRNRAARDGRDPSNPSKIIHIPALRVPVFKAGKGLKDMVK